MPLHDKQTILNARTRIFLLLLVMILAACGGDDSEPLPERAIYDALRYGDGVFPESEWAAYAQEGQGYARAGWRSNALNAVAWIDYLYFETAVDQAGLVTTFDEAWFADALSEYATWEQVSACIVEGTIIYDFSLQAEGVAYTGRFWGRAVEPTEVLTLYMVFPAVATAALDTHARRFDADAMSCDP